MHHSFLWYAEKGLLTQQMDFGHWVADFVLIQKVSFNNIFSFDLVGDKLIDTREDILGRLKNDLVLSQKTK